MTAPSSGGGGRLGRPTRVFAGSNWGLFCKPSGGQVKKKKTPSHAEEREENNLLAGDGERRERARGLLRCGIKTNGQ